MPTPTTYAFHPGTGTYINTDECYFVQADNEGNIYRVFGCAVLRRPLDKGSEEGRRIVEQFANVFEFEDAADDSLDWSDDNGADEPTMIDSLAAAFIPPMSKADIALINPPVDPAHLCDCCGDDAGYPNHVSDEEVCGSSDGPGFMLCGQDACEIRYHGLGVEARRKLFSEGRERNRR